MIADNILNDIATKKSEDILNLYARTFSAECFKKVTGLYNMTADETDRFSQGMIDRCANYV